MSHSLASGRSKRQAATGIRFDQLNDIGKQTHDNYLNPIPAPRPVLQQGIPNLSKSLSALESSIHNRTFNKSVHSRSTPYQSPVIRGMAQYDDILPNGAVSDEVLDYDEEGELTDRLAAQNGQGGGKSKSA